MIAKRRRDLQRVVVGDFFLNSFGARDFLSVFPIEDLTPMSGVQLCSAWVRAYYENIRPQFKSPDVVRGFTDALNFVMGIKLVVAGFGATPKNNAQLTRQKVVRRIVERYAHVDPGVING